MIVKRNKNFTSDEWKMKAHLGRLRVTGANIMTKVGDYYSNQNKRLEGIMGKAKRVENADLNKKLNKIIKDNNLKVVEKSDKNKYQSDSRTIYHKDNGIDSLAHEIGHSINHDRGSKISKEVDRVKPIVEREINASNSRIKSMASDDIKMRKSAQKIQNGIDSQRRKYLNEGDLVDYYHTDKGANEFKDKINKVRDLVLEDEDNATREGLSLLKKSGASKSELDRAKRNLKLARKSYEYAKKRDNSYLTANSLNIPSRRVTPTSGIKNL